MFTYVNFSLSLLIFSFYVKLFILFPITHSLKNSNYVYVQFLYLCHSSSTCILPLDLSVLPIIVALPRCSFSKVLYLMNSSITHVEFSSFTKLIFVKWFCNIIVVNIRVIWCWFSRCFVNPLSGNPTKWSNTLKQFVGSLLNWTELIYGELIFFLV